MDPIITVFVLKNGWGQLYLYSDRVIYFNNLYTSISYDQIKDFEVSDKFLTVSTKLTTYSGDTFESRNVDGNRAKAAQQLISEKVKDQEKKDATKPVETKKPPEGYTFKGRMLGLREFLVFVVIAIILFLGVIIGPAILSSFH